MIFENEQELISYVPILIHKSAADNITFKQNVKLNYDRTFTHFFRQWLGDALILNILNMADASEATDPNFLELVKKAAAIVTFAHSISLIDLTLSSNGFVVTSNAELSPASKDRIMALKDAIAEAVNVSLNNLLYYLQDHIDDFPLWNKSTIAAGCFVLKNDDFNAATGFFIAPSEFYALKPYLFLFRVECNRLFSDTEMSNIHGTDLSVEQTELLTILKRAASYKALAATRPQQGYEKIAEAELLQAKGYITNNLTKFPTYEAEKYVAPYENTAESKIFRA